MRDEISKKLGWDSTLIPSYLLKTVLLSELFITDRYRWDKDCRAQRTIQALELALQGVKTEKIPNFFKPWQNALTVTDHDNKLRQCVLEDMLNQIKGLELAYTQKDAKKRKQQIRALQMTDLVDYMISGLLTGKNPTAVWNKMFLNIENLPFGPLGRRGSRRFMIFDLNTTELDEGGYRRLIQIWKAFEAFFKKLLNTLEGELNLLARKFYIRTCEMKEKFECEHKGLCEQQVEEVPLRQIVIEWLDELVSCYTKEDNSSLPNIHKAISPEYKASGFLKDVADVTVNEGSDKGLALLKQRIEPLLSMVPENYIMAAVVDHVSQLILHSKEVLKRKLDYITIPELDLD